MSDPQRPAPPTPRRPEAQVPIPDALARALRRRQLLDEQQRNFQGTYPPPHLNSRRPPG